MQFHVGDENFTNARSTSCWSVKSCNFGKLRDVGPALFFSLAKFFFVFFPIASSNGKNLVRHLSF